MDGYDKLKPYCVRIHGAVDGFSRMIIWLKDFNTNNDLKIIAFYYFEAVVENGGSPCIVPVPSWNRECLCA